MTARWGMSIESLVIRLLLSFGQTEAILLPVVIIAKLTFNSGVSPFVQHGRASLFVQL